MSGAGIYAEVGVKIKRFSRQSKGFTLIEVITVVVIIMIISAIAIPSMTPVIENIQLSMAVKSIKGQLICAKTRALGDSKIHCGVHFDTTLTPPHLQVFIDNGSPEHDGIYTKNSDQNFGGEYILPLSVIMKIEGTGKNRDIIYRGDGSTKVHGMILKLTTRRGTTHYLTVLPSTGRVKVYD
jgi:prepilin-type N-terminal cleavage/methylation domain-containing protein